MTQYMNEDKKFEPSEHMMQLKSREGSKDYLPVQWRIVWFRQECPQGTIDTEEVTVDLDREMEEEAFVWNSEKRRSEKVIKKAKGYARFKATITDGKGGRATGTKSESAASFSDFVEKAETGAIGRALAALGYGTAFAPELNEEHRIADAPVDRSQGDSNGNGKVASIAPVSQEKAASAPSQGGLPGMVTENQVGSIRNLCKLLGKAEPANFTTMTFDEAKELMGQLGVELRNRPATRKAS